METLQPLSSAGYCQDCSELIATMLKGGLFKPTLLAPETAEERSLWPISPDCKLCEMISSTKTYTPL